MSQGTSADAAPGTRRERLRRELVAEVVATARRNLADGGPSSVSWRGIAREVGVNPATLYTYFDSLDDLFTAVIVESFGRLGAAVGRAAEGATDLEPVERVMACARAYRSWAIQHPAEFNLIFTDRIPGYVPPPAGPTVEAQVGIFGPFIAALDDMAGAGDPVQDMPGLSAERVALWAVMHGFVMLEINHHLPFVDDPDHLFDVGLLRSLAELR